MNKTRNFAILVLIMIFSLFMAACAGSETESVGGNTESKPKESVSISASDSQSDETDDSMDKEFEKESLESESKIESESQTKPEESESESQTKPEESKPEESESESASESESETQSETEKPSISINPDESESQEIILNFVFVIYDEFKNEVGRENYALEGYDSISLRVFVEKFTKLGDLYSAQQNGFFTQYDFVIGGEYEIVDGDTICYTYYPQTTEITVSYNEQTYTVEKGYTLNQFITENGFSFEGRWLVNGEEKGFEYEFADGDVITNEPIGDGGGYNVKYIDNKLGIDTFLFCEPNITLERFISNLLWSYMYDYRFANFDEFIENGSFTIEFETGITDGNYVLYAEYTVEYVWNEQGGCDHVYNENGFCYNCGEECQHVLDENGVCKICGIGKDKVVDCAIYLCYFDAEGTPYVDYVPSTHYITCKFNTEYGQEPTLYNIVLEYFGFDMVNTEEGWYNFSWYRNGENIFADDLVNDGDYIVAVTSEYKVSPFTITVSVDGKEEKTYSYENPVSYDMITEDYLKTVDIETSNYTVRVTYNGKSFDEGINYCSVIATNTEITFVENTISISVVYVDESGESEENLYTYSASQKPNLSQFFDSIKISAEEYFVLNGGKPIENFDTQDYYSLKLIKKSLVPSSFTVSVYCKEDYEYDFSWTGTTTLTEPTTLYWLLSNGFEDENQNYYSHMMDVYRYIYKINGENLTSDLELRGSVYDYLVMHDCRIEIVPGFRFSVSVGNEYYEFITEEKLNGVQILEKCGIENLDLNNYRIRQDSWFFIEKDMFLNETYPYSGTNSVSFTFEPGKVMVFVMVEDEFGGTISENFEGEISLTVGSCAIGDSFDNYTWRVKLPDGTEIEVTDRNYLLKFNPTFAEEHGYSMITQYSLYGESKNFKVILYIDDEYIGEKTFEKAKNYTFGQIVEEYGYSYSAYDWTFYGDWYGENDLVNKRIEVYGRDNRPTATIYVGGQSYVIYHTETITLAQLLSLVNEEYGVEIKYEDYLWNYGENDIVAEVGYSGSASGRTLTSVTVYFCSEYGPIDGSINWETGESNYKFTADSVWEYPTDGFILDMAYGLMDFVGKWEYRPDGDSEGEIIPVNSVEELFALRKEEVYLNAVFEPNYEKLSGTYCIVDGYSRVYTIDNDSITYIEVNGKNESITCGYTLKLEAGMFRLETEYGMIIDGMYLQEGYKMTQDKFYAFIIYPWGTVEYYDTMDYYFSQVENYNIVSITDYNGNVCETIEMGGIYFVTVEEKIYEEIM